MRITHRFLVTAILIPLVGLTAVGAYLLWPESQKHTPANLGANTQLVNGTVTTVTSGPCPGDPSDNVCQTAAITVTSGPDSGQHITLTMQQGPGQPSLAYQDKIVLGRAVDNTSPQATYFFSDFQRKSQLIWLSLAFSILVILIARWRGVGALIGLVFTWLTISHFILPAILEGKSPMLVALTGASAIVIVALYVAHGFKPRTTIALIGTMLSLGLTGLLAMFAVKLAHLTGLSSEEATYVQNFAGQINLQGLLLGGVIIGSLGALNDMTITQASTVVEIHEAQPTRRRRHLYTSAMRVGRDHIASSVYTLVLAYVGATLPLLIVFAIAGRQFGDVVSSDVVAEEIVRTLVGTIGLILCVPLTTALAALVMKNDTPPVVVDLDEPPLPEEQDETTSEINDQDFSPEELEDLESDEVVEIDEHVLVSSETMTPDDSLADYNDKPIELSTQMKASKRGVFGRKQITFDRKMTRRERKFWDD